MATTPAAKKKAGKTQRLDETPSSPVLVKATIVKKKDEIAKTRHDGYEPVTVDKVVAVIDRIENGQSERSACEAEHVSRTSFRTMALRANMGDHYARALEALAQAQVEALEKTIEDMRTGTIDASMARVEIDARKWFASKFLPKRYGDKLDVTSDGKAMPAPIISIAGQNAIESNNS